VIAAVITVRAPSGAVRAFEAERVAIDNGLVTATGRWRGTKDRRRRAYSWPASCCREIRWTHEAVTPA
jgi:hypothetical protein